MSSRCIAIARAAVFIGLLLTPRLSGAAAITFETVDLADVTVGEDLWRYTYIVEDAIFNIDDGFAIFFDEAEYGALLASTPDTDPGVFSTTDLEWDVLLISPDPPLFGDGVFDALSFVDAALTSTFTVDFVWKGTSAPGLQPFNLYRLADDFSVIVLEEGLTELKTAAPVPEPGTLALLAMGLAGVSGRRFLRHR